jgi:PAS domain S-box-containing protein
MPDIAPAALVDALPDAAIVAGRDGLITTWNAAAERIFGFTAPEAMGQSLDLIIPENFRERHWTAFDRSMETGYTKYVGQVLATRALTRSGKQIYIDVAFGVLRNDAGEVVGAVEIGRAHV